MTDGRLTDHYPISSPGAFSPGELKVIMKKAHSSGQETFSNDEYWYYSYFSTEIYVVGTH